MTRSLRDAAFGLKRAASCCIVMGVLCTLGPGYALAKNPELAIGDACTTKEVLKLRGGPSTRGKLIEVPVGTVLSITNIPSKKRLRLATPDERITGFILRRKAVRGCSWYTPSIMDGKVCLRCSNRYSWIGAPAVLNFTGFRCSGDIVSD